jgi:phytoene dehydrogenase-like protein
MDRLMLSQAVTKALTLATFGTDMSKESVYSCLPRHLSKDTYGFVDTISYFLSGKSMRETSVYRILYGSSFVRNSAIYDGGYQTITDQLVGQITSITGLGRLVTNKTSYAQAYPSGGLKTQTMERHPAYPLTTRLMMQKRSSTQGLQRISLG